MTQRLAAAQHCGRTFGLSIAPMQQAEEREQIIERPVCVLHKRSIWAEPER
jgi:hypothetical protein